MTASSSLDAFAPERLFSCAGQVAIVTGGASGIGAASARALAAAGAKVMVAGLTESRLGDLVAELRDAGADAASFECDVTDDAALERMAHAVLQRWGRLTMVLACAGAALDVPGAEDHLERLERMFALHVRSVTRLADLALPAMADAGGGAFVIMSSLSGLRGNRVLSGYGVTKAASAQLARNLAVQWGARGIRANAISPGVVDTGFSAPITADPEIAAARQARTPLGRFGRVEEIAGAVVWLASAAGSFVNGQNIVIDGGTLVYD